MAGNIINFSAARAERTAAASARVASSKPEWGDDIHTVCAYARLVRAEHEAESVRIKFDQLQRGISDAWWNGPDDIRDRVHENNRTWDRYIGVCQHVAGLPAGTRREAADKRNTIGKAWLGDDSTIPTITKPMRAGCLADDHLFPPSIRLARANIKTGE